MALLPFIRLRGESLLRIDLPSRSLLFFGERFRVEELHLLLFALLLLLVLLLALTLVLGRVWCGWACPQTLYSDLYEGFGRFLSRRRGLFKHTPIRKALLHLFSLLLSVLTACVGLWYFLAPWDFYHLLLAGKLPFAAWAFLLLIALPTYVNLAFIRRLMCREFCPYGRFQTVLVDPATLTLHLPASEASRCTDCKACVRACPMGIDIRMGYQIECINCGRCLDACRDQMGRRGNSGLIRYSFGTTGLGFRALLSLRLLLLLVVSTALGAGLFFSAQNRPQADLLVALSKTARSRLLPTGEQVTFFTLTLINHREDSLQGRVLARPEGDGAIDLRGIPTPLTLEPGAKRRLNAAAVTDALGTNERRTIWFLLQDAEGNTLADAEALLTPP